MHVDSLDLDAHYNRAWFELYEAMGNGVRIVSLEGWLVVVVLRRAYDESRRFDESRVVKLADFDADIYAVRDTTTDEAYLADRLDQVALVQQWTTHVRLRLNDRERRAYVLSVFYGQSRPQIAAALGVRYRRLNKILDAARCKVRSRLSAIHSEGCQERSLTAALVAGVLVKNSTRYRIATDHLRGCPTCAVAARVARATNRDRHEKQAGASW